MIVSPSLEKGRLYQYGNNAIHLLRVSFVPNAHGDEINSAHRPSVKLGQVPIQELDIWNNIHVLNKILGLFSLEDNYAKY
jgi:hypothetical protein